MGSENLDSADNQQERLSSEEARSWFIAGFVEGEGSVTVSIKRHGGNPFGLYIQPEFFVYQHRVRRELLEMAQGVLRGRPDSPETGQSGRPRVLHHVEARHPGARFTVPLGLR